MGKIEHELQQQLKSGIDDVGAEINKDMPSPDILTDTHSQSTDDEQHEDDDDTSASDDKKVASNADKDKS